MKTLLTPLLLIVSTLFFVANANAETIKTNIAGLVLKDVYCSDPSVITGLGSFNGRWVNRNNHSLGKKAIDINMYDSDGDPMGRCTVFVRNMGSVLKIEAETGSSFFSSCSVDCSFATTVSVTARTPKQIYDSAGNIKRK